MSPNCVRCGGSSFGLTYVTPSGARFKYSAIYCTGCGGVVSFAEFYNIGDQIAAQNRAIEKIARKQGVSVDLMTES